MQTPFHPRSSPAPATQNPFDGQEPSPVRALSVIGGVRPGRAGPGLLASRKRPPPHQTPGRERAEAADGVGVPFRFVDLDRAAPRCDGLRRRPPPARSATPRWKSISACSRGGSVPGQGGRLAEVPEGVREGGGREGAAAGQDEVAEEPGGVGGRTRLDRDARRSSRHGRPRSSAWSRFHRLGHPEVLAAPPGGREPAQEPSGGSVRGRTSTLHRSPSPSVTIRPGPLGGVHGVDQVIAFAVGNGLPQLEAEVASGHGGDRQRPAAVASSSRSRRRPITRRTLAGTSSSPIDEVVAGTSPSLVEQPAGLGQVPEDLLDEESIARRCRRRWPPGLSPAGCWWLMRLQQLLDFGSRCAAGRFIRAHLAAADEVARPSRLAPR